MRVASVRAFGVAIVMLLATARFAAAEAPDKVFAGTIVASAKAFAPAAKTDTETVAAIKKQAAVTFAENKADHTWTVFLVGYFKAPVDDVEYLLKVHDLSNKTAVLMTANKYLPARGATVASTKIVLDKDKVGVNKELLVTMEVKGKVLATTRLRIVGEYEKGGTGTVDFHDGDDDDDDDAPATAPKAEKK
jgi:hypothetical protein